jgi:hypothetical protein
MAGFVVLIIALSVAAVVSAAILVVALAVRREERHYSLVGEAPDRLSRSARLLTGVGSRDLDPEFFRRAGELVH